MPALALEVGLGSHHVSDLLFRPWWGRLVSLEFRNARFVRGRDVVIRSALSRHSESFGRYHRQRMSPRSSKDRVGDGHRGQTILSIDRDCQHSLRGFERYVASTRCAAELLHGIRQAR